MICDARTQRLLRIGQGLAHFLDRTFQQQRRALQAQADALDRTNSGGVDEYRRLHQCMKEKQLAHDKYVTRLHVMACNLLVCYNLVVLPEFSAKRCHGVTRRICGHLHFYAFRQRLKRRCVARGVLLPAATEAWTTQWCGECQAGQSPLCAATQN